MSKRAKDFAFLYLSGTIQACNTSTHLRARHFWQYWGCVSFSSSSMKHNPSPTTAERYRRKQTQDKQIMPDIYFCVFQWNTKKELQLKICRWYTHNSQYYCIPGLESTSNDFLSNILSPQQSFLCRQLNTLGKTQGSTLACLTEATYIYVPPASEVCARR